MKYSLQTEQITYISLKYSMDTAIEIKGGGIYIVCFQALLYLLVKINHVN